MSALVEEGREEGREAYGIEGDDGPDNVGVLEDELEASGLLDRVESVGKDRDLEGFGPRRDVAGSGREGNLVGGEELAAGKWSERDFEEEKGRKKVTKRGR